MSKEGNSWGPWNPGRPARQPGHCHTPALKSGPRTQPARWSAAAINPYERSGLVRIERIGQISLSPTSTRPSPLSMTYRTRNKFLFRLGLRTRRQHVGAHPLHDSDSQMNDSLGFYERWLTTALAAVTIQVRPHKAQHRYKGAIPTALYF